jgi:hypothetical protein
MPSTPQQQAAEELVLLRHAVRATAFRGLMEPDEFVHNTAPVLFLQVAETRGPAAGEGILLVASNGLVWGPEDAEVMVGAELQALEQAREGRSPSGAASVPTQGLGFAGFRWPKRDIRNFEERRCPRSWRGISTGLSRRQRSQSRLLHIEVGDTVADLMGHFLFIGDVVRYLRGETPAVAVIGRRVIWGDDGETGGTFAVVKDANGNVAHTSSPYPARSFDADDPELESTNALANQALGELCVRLGLEPRGGYEWPRPAWMPEFRWEPPLPAGGTKF